MLNLFKYFDQKSQTIFIQKCFNNLRQNVTQVAKYIPRGENVSIPPIFILLSSRLIHVYFTIHESFLMILVEIKKVEKSLAYFFQFDLLVKEDLYFKI